MSRINLLHTQDEISTRRKQDTKLRVISMVVGGIVLTLGSLLLGASYIQQRSFDSLLLKKADLIRRTAEAAGMQKKLSLIDAALRYIQKERMSSPDYLGILKETTEVIQASESSLLSIELQQKETLVNIEFTNQNELTQFLSFVEAKPLPDGGLLNKIEIKSITAPALNKPVTLQVRFPYGPERTTKK